MHTSSLKPIAVLGAGSWGTALALYLSRRGQQVQIWSIESSEIDAMLTDNANNRYLPGHSLPDTMKPCLTLREALQNVEDVLMVVPSIGFRQTLLSIKEITQEKLNIICASKGIDDATGQLLNATSAEVLGQNHRFAVLSGPSFAKEVAQSVPTAVTIASDDDNLLKHLYERFNSDIFSIDLSHDVKGVEIGGIIKNVIAIACGISDGMGYGINTRSAIITRGLSEITALGVKLGAEAKTFIGLSGIGDLILTCSDNQSRNKRLGLLLGEGQTVEAAEKIIGQVVEGKKNAALVVKLAEQNKVKMPICEKVWSILKGESTVNDAVKAFIK